MFFDEKKKLGGAVGISKPDGSIKDDYEDGPGDDEVLHMVVEELANAFGIDPAQVDTKAAVEAIKTLSLCLSQGEG